MIELLSVLLRVIAVAFAAGSIAVSGFIGPRRSNPTNQAPTSRETNLLPTCRGRGF